PSFGVSAARPHQAGWPGRRRAVSSPYDGKVQLPAHVRRMIEERADKVGFAALKRAATAISAAYRAGLPKGARTAHLTGEERTAAYLVTRMPATYAAAHAALGQVRAQ